MEAGLTSHICHTDLHLVIASLATLLNILTEIKALTSLMQTSP